MLGVIEATPIPQSNVALPAGSIIIAAANGSVLPVTEIVDGYYEQLQELGLGRWDTSTLIHLLRQE